MSSSYKGYWINGSNDTGFTAERWKDANAPANLVRQLTLSAIKRAIDEALKGK